MLLTTVAYSSQLIQAYRGKKLTYNGQRNIPYNLLGLLQLGPNLVYSLGKGAHFGPFEASSI
jgi:hypothetical protein